MALYPRLTHMLRSTNRIKIVGNIRTASSLDSEDSEISTEEFRVFDVRSGKAKEEKPAEKFVKPPPLPPREKSMPTDQDWPSVWPGPRTFHPAVVPLPVRQGSDKRGKLVAPQKYGNVELMKLPNFLHLTPPAIKRHCDVLKKFCTPWPKQLETDEDLKKHFPLEIITTDYCFSSPRIRDPKARIVTFKFQLSEFPLNEHGKDKMKRLLGDRYNAETDEVTLVTDRCPTRKQNYQYNKYLLLALFFESSSAEAWEEEKCEEDMEYYDWEKNKSKRAYLVLKSWPKPLEQIDVAEVSLENDEDAQMYKEAVTDIFMNGDNIENIFKYKEAVLKLVL